MRPELRRLPVALYTERRGWKVIAASRQALARGIFPGMPVAEASGVHLEEYQPALDREVLVHLAAWCEEFSPTVGLEESARPECLLLDVGGTAALFGDEASLAEQVARAFHRRQYRVHLAIADTVGAAWAAARSAHPLCIIPAGEIPAALAELPVHLLRISDECASVLAELGIERIGQLLSLPCSLLASRFAPELLRRLRQALGTEEEPILSCHACPTIVAEHVLEYPLADRQAIGQVLDALAGQVVCALADRGAGAVSLQCRLRCEGQETVDFEVGLFQASASAPHLRELLRTRLDRVVLSAPTVGVQLTVTHSARLVSQQRSLFDDDGDTRRELALVMDRLSNRLGAQSVLLSSPVADAQPEYAYRYQPLTGQRSQRSQENQRSPAKKAHNEPLRPLLLEPRPLLLTVVAVSPEGPPVRFRLRGRDYRVTRSWGPERIQTGWWRGSYRRRDYYRVRTDEGSRFWLFRCARDWFWHGEFA